MTRSDINEDRIANVDELNRLGRNRARPDESQRSPLLVLLEESTDWNHLLRSLRHAYSPGEAFAGDAVSNSVLERIQRGDRSLSRKDLVNLLYLPPDIAYRVSFSEKEKGVELLALGDALRDNQVASHANAITLAIGNTELEFSAAGVTGRQSDFMAHTQVSLGAVAEGYPLLSLVDVNGDSRLTVRELRQLSEQLNKLDANQDGQLERRELSNSVRLAVTFGPHAHEYLRSPAVEPLEDAAPTEVEPPVWFVGMDRNRDGDISRREFQGSTEQFTQLDKDGDGLISPTEAQE